MANKIIFIEGIDHCGKDSMIKRALSKLEDKKVSMHHCIGPGPNDICASSLDKSLFQLYSFYDQLRTAVEDDSDAYIFNRSFLGEYVWNEFFQRNDQVDGRHVIDTLMNTKLFKDNISKFIGIFIDVSDKNVIERIKASEEDNGIYTKCMFKDIEKNVKYVKEKFNELRDITSQHIHTIKLNSDILSDIDINAKILTDIIKGN